MTEREIGMGKLMKYVEEMQKEGINVCRPTFQEYYLLEMMLISKYYGLIKWLVENDKISNDGIKPRTDLVKEITIVDYKTGDAIGWKNKYTEVEQLIMYLSIQDEPIRFLCEILK